jgi:hypothetical protein
VRGRTKKMKPLAKELRKNQTDAEACYGSGFETGI